MTNSGIMRKIDAPGRIVIPKEIRDAFGWRIGTPLQIYTEGHKVVLAKYEPLCAFCGEPTDTQIEHLRICPDCAAKFLHRFQIIASKAD